MKTIYATILWKLPASGYHGNNFFICQLGEELDNAGIQVNAILTKKERDGMKITVEVETEMSEDVTEGGAEEWIYQALTGCTELPGSDNILMSAKSEFAEELEAA